MAINERVGILTHFGPRVETPGLIDGIYAEFLTKEFDFLDDVRNWPQSSDFVSDPMVYIGTNDWEDFSNYFRQWRDQRSNFIRNYWFSRLNRTKFNYENIVLDSNPLSNNGNGSNEFEKLRFVFPSKDGEINYPYPDTLIGSDHYSFFNHRRPLMVDKVRMSMKSISDLGKLLTFQNPEILASLENQDGDSKLNLTAYDFADTGKYSSIHGTIKLSDGKLYVYGNDIQLNSGQTKDIYRFNADGSVDTSFDITLGGNSTYITTAELQSDGKIIIAGKFDEVNGVVAHDIVRLNSNGTLDNTFNRSKILDGNAIYNGVRQNDQNVWTIKIQPDGKILVGGYFYVTSVNMYGLVRLNSDGTLDTTFADGLSMPEGTYGGLFEDPKCIELQSDGKILVGGSQWMAWGVQGSFDPITNNTQVGVIRLNSDGTLDTTFDIGNVFYNNGGYNSYIYSIKVLSTGEILIGGQFGIVWPGVTEGINNLVLLNSDGTFSKSYRFSSPVNQFIKRLGVQSDGKIIAVGDFQSYDGQNTHSIVRINLDGSYDDSFAAHGFMSNNQNPQIFGLTIIGDEVIVAGGFNAYINKLGSQYSVQNNIARFTTLPIHKTAYQTLMEYFDDKQTINYLIDESLDRDLTEEEQSLFDTLKTKCIAIDFDTVLVDAATDTRVRDAGWLGYSLITKFPGITEINMLPEVDSLNMLPATASVGDIRIVSGSGAYTWDAVNNVWSDVLVYDVLDNFLVNFRSLRDPKLQKRYYVELAMRPLLFSALYIPSFQLLADTDGKICKNLSKPITMN